MSSSGPSPPGGAPVTDSPWFWLGLFSLAALVALVAIGPKFERRHARLELQSQAREQIWRERIEGSSEADQANADNSSPIAESHSSQGGWWLWPLGALALVVTSVCWGRLWWQRRLVAISPHPS